MKNHIKIISFILLILVSLSFIDFKNSKQFVVVLDAGHGGKDKGTIGYNDLQEKEVNLSIALVTKFLINKYDSNIKVILTRDNDVFIPLKKRSEIAKYFQADLFISIHADYNPNKNAKGIAIFIEKNIHSKKYKIDNYRKSLIFGLKLNNILTKKVNMKSRGILFKNLSVLRNTLNHMPSVLLEVGFISNREEALFFEKKGKKALAYSLSKAIIEYKNNE